MTTPSSPAIIIGLGKTGQSCARYFTRQNRPYYLVDTRKLSPHDNELINNTAELILSPGVPPERFPNHKLISDIELFAREAKAPIIAITGTNAKGTVTTLVHNMIHDAGFTALMGGNIGIPALDLLTQPIPDFYVLELSSFQLEITQYLPTLLSTILNISPDHLDRHKTLDQYIQAKQKIYVQCQYAVYNQDDLNTKPNSTLANNITHIDFFSLDILKNYPDLNSNNLKIKGTHNLNNALAALKIGERLNLPRKTMIGTLEKFPGLEHRCEWVAQHNNIHWYNDSKGTNVGATLAAIQGLGDTLSQNSKIILIAGGLGKDQDFSLLRPALKKYIRALILIGQDADIIKQAVITITNHYYYNFTILNADSLEQAVMLAQQHAIAHDLILLSPACASFDMFNDFEDRGTQFKTCVKNLLGLT